MSSLKRSAPWLALSAAIVQLAFAAGAEATVIHTTCTPTEVAVWSNRIHVKCTEKISGIEYFAVEVKSRDLNLIEVARFQNVVSEALVHGRQLTMYWDTTDFTADSYGCGKTNCRRPSTYIMK